VDNRAWPAIAKFVCQRAHLNFSRSARGARARLSWQRPTAATISDTLHAIYAPASENQLDFTFRNRACGAGVLEAGQLERVRARAGPGWLLAVLKRAVVGTLTCCRWATSHTVIHLSITNTFASRPFPGRAYRARHLATVVQTCLAALLDAPTGHG
jgi:hypothetical protein